MQVVVNVLCTATHFVSHFMFQPVTPLSPPGIFITASHMLWMSDVISNIQKACTVSVFFFSVLTFLKCGENPETGRTPWRTSQPMYGCECFSHAPKVLILTRLDPATNPIATTVLSYAPFRPSTHPSILNSKEFSDEAKGGSNSGFPTRRQ